MLMGGILPTNQNRPRRAALASWVELLNSQAGGGHNYEDVEHIFGLCDTLDNNENVLAFRSALSRLSSTASRVYVSTIT